MKALIVHGWGADSLSNWFPWLKNELEKLGIETLCPDLPNANFPKKDEWTASLRAQSSFLEKENVILVGHSLGCPAILGLLEAFKKGEKARAAILVSGFEHDIGIQEIRNFTEKGFDFKKIRAACGEFRVINSDNDPFVPLEEGKQLAKSLGTALILEKGAGHINMGDGYLEYNRVLELIKKLAEQA
ncbi:Serine hydrolase [uncultured archaeon]|nr:Serine hydrolase [uncultured archaeon]